MVKGLGFGVGGVGVSVYTFVESFHKSDEAVRVLHLIAG